jgi:hypothetical protein
MGVPTLLPVLPNVAITLAPPHAWPFVRARGTCVRAGRARVVRSGPGLGRRTC